MDNCGAQLQVENVIKELTFTDKSNNFGLKNQLATVFSIGISHLQQQQIVPMKVHYYTYMIVLQLLLYPKKA